MHEEVEIFFFWFDGATYRLKKISGYISKVPFSYQRLLLIKNWIPFKDGNISILSFSPTSLWKTRNLLPLAVNWHSCGVTGSLVRFIGFSGTFLSSLKYSISRRYVLVEDKLTVTASHTWSSSTSKIFWIVSGHVSWCLFWLLSCRVAMGEGDNLCLW